MNLTGLRALPLVSIVVFAGCEPLQPAQGLEDVDIPADFHFETARQVGLELSVADGLRAEGLRIEIRKPDGGLVYSGLVSEASGWKVQPRLTLPLYVEQVEVRLSGDGIDQRATVPVDAEGAGRHTFG